MHQGTRIVRRGLLAGGGSGQCLAILIEPVSQQMRAGLFRVGAHQGDIVCKSFADPLIPIVVPADHVAPPLVGDFVVGNDGIEGFLRVVAHSGVLLRDDRQERKRGQVEKSGKSLPHVSRELRHDQLVKRKWSHPLLFKANRVRDFEADFP